MGFLLFDIDMLFSRAYSKGNVLVGEKPFFPFTREMIHQMREQKRQPIVIESTSIKSQPIEIDSDSDNDSDEE